MNNKARASIFFVILLLLASLGAAGFYFISYENEKKLSKNLEEQLNSIKNQKDKLETQLAQINKEKASLEEKLIQNEQIVSELNDKLIREIKAKDLLITEKETLKNKVLEIEKTKGDIQKTLNDKVKELAELQSRLDTTISEKNELEKRIKEVSFSKENTENLDKIVVTPASSTQDTTPDSAQGPAEESKEPPPPSLSAKVLLINREYGFLVINVGKNNGIELGNVFEISHENTLIGNVQIEKVHDTMSAANFLEGFKEDQVKEGDLAKRIN